MIYAINKQTKEHKAYSVMADLPVTVMSGNYDIVQADADGWIKWEGGDDCPLPPTVKCQILLPGQSKDKCGIAHEAEAWGWSVVTYYRPILPEQTVEQPAEAEWDGEGLPPVGTTCEWSDCVRPYKKVLVMGYYEESVWIRVFNSDAKGDNFSITAHLRVDSFRPIRTPEQRAEDEALAQMEYLIEDSTGEPANSSHLTIIYRAIKLGELEL